MQKKIQILSDQTINQIAAGEVIENPASVVKELVENSIDAGSSSIIIEIKGGGFQLIRVIDNGVGMSSDDAILSLERHATSKIRNLQDLDDSRLMGFRGEALASIAAVSRLTLSTQQKGEPLGTILTSEGGKLRMEEGARNPGTTLEIRSLFYNVPARRKFQKSPAASLTEIIKMFSRLALAHPEIGFELISNERQMLKSKEKLPFEVRIADVLGEPFLEEMKPIEVTDGEMKITGFIGTPLLSRHNRSGQHLFLNQRPVKCPEINYAIYDGYGTRLQERKHPTYVLLFSLPNALVDVNVHPQKLEVRLREHNLIKEWIQKVISNAFDAPKAARIIQSRPSYESQEELFPLKFREEPQEEMGEILPLHKQLDIIGLSSHFLLVDGKSAPHKPFDGILLIDLLEVKRLLYFEQLEEGEIQNELEGLLSPITLSFSPAESDQINQNIAALKGMGIGIRPFGKETFLIDALHPLFQIDEAKQLVYKALENKNLLKEKHLKLAKMLSTFAKKSITLYEAKLLTEELFKRESPEVSLHGKPTMVRISHEKLTNLFRSAEKAPL